MGKHRYNIQEVHDRTGLARQTISALYNDKVTRLDFSTIEKLCELFKCDVGELLSLVDNEDNQAKVEAKDEISS
jgi:putative transcriptional regulator